MKKRLIAGIALGAAGLFVVPAGIAYAVSANASPRSDPPQAAVSTFGPQAVQGRANAGGPQGHADPGVRGGGQAPTTPYDPATLVEPGSTLTAAETASLTFMIEEEKLAHDLYVELGDAWDLRVFANIANAETQHETNVRTLLDAYGVDDPTANMNVGEFSDPALQSLYDTLLKKGLTSSTDALEVGAVVEETDIADLRERASTNTAIDEVFGLLESGSNNHLRAFTRNLDRLGVTYVPQVLSPADVANIIGQ